MKVGFVCSHQYNFCGSETISNKGNVLLNFVLYFEHLYMFENIVVIGDY